MAHPELLHPALHALPDITLAIDPAALRVLDVNRAEAFGRAREVLAGTALRELFDLPHAAIERFVLAADGRAVDLHVKLPDATRVRATARAATSAGAAARPCVLVVVREAPEHGRLLEEVARIEATLRKAVEALGDLTRAAPEPEAPLELPDDALVEQEPIWVPELSLAQYASFCVEHELGLNTARDIDARYGMGTEASRAELHRQWGERLTADPAAATQFKALSAQYRDWYVAQQRAREASAITPQTHAVAAATSAATARAMPDASPSQPRAAASGPPAFPSTPGSLTSSAASAASAPSAAPAVPSQASSQVFGPLGAQAAALAQTAPSMPAAPQAQDAAEARKQQRTTAPAAPNVVEGRGAALPWSGSESAPAAAGHAKDGASEPSSAGPFDVRSTIGVNEALSQGHALPFKAPTAPDLTVEQFAALGVELEAYPERRNDVLAMYGIMSEASFRACDGAWATRFAADPALRQKWMKLSADLRTKLVRR